jgi:hypothetical protein
VVSGLESRDALANSFHDSGTFVSEDYGKRGRQVLVPNMKVGLAYPGSDDPNKNLVWPGIVEFNLSNYEGARLRLNDSSLHPHSVRPLVAEPLDSRHICTVAIVASGVPTAFSPRVLAKLFKEGNFRHAARFLSYEVVWPMVVRGHHDGDISPLRLGHCRVQALSRLSSWCQNAEGKLVLNTFILDERFLACGASN